MNTNTRIDEERAMHIDGGQTTQLVSQPQKLTWYQWAWAGAPLLLVVLGGGLGGAIGGVAGYFNVKLMRSGMSTVSKYILTGMVTVLAVILYFVAALIISRIIAGG